MKQILLFHLEHCPYCINAKKALEDIFAQHPEYRDTEIRWVEESQEEAFASAYDYYYVPTVFYEGSKLYEADPSQNYEDIRQSLLEVFRAIYA